MKKSALKAAVLKSLADQGFRVDRGRIVPPPLDDKAQLRDLHAEAVRARIARAAPGLRRHEDRLLQFVANGDELDPAAIRPRLVQVRAESEQELLFRYARLHWSIPVSAGYGRRLRFIVEDASNGKLIGLIGLGDPVGALRPRDSWVGWDRAARLQRLRGVMDAFVLGAVPPYSMLLGGKLVALLASTAEVREAFRRKYGKGESLITGRPNDARLLLLTTSSALGRSSIYNRLRHGGTSVYTSVGYTRGSGDFHFSNGLYKAIMEYAQERLEPTAKHSRWGTGFRNRREVVRKTLLDIGLSPELVYHGIRREVFVVPMARNAAAVLRGEQSRPMWYHRRVADVAAAFRERWLLPRAARDHRYREFSREQYRLWPKG